MASIIPQMSLFLGIIPALLLLWIGLRGYEGMYKDKNIFLTFMVGIVIGFIAVLLELVFKEVLLLSIILFPLLEQMLKVIILNIGRFHEKEKQSSTASHSALASALSPHQPHYCSSHSNQLPQPTSSSPSSAPLDSFSTKVQRASSSATESTQEN